MSFLFKNIILKPAHVSWISFILLALIVVGIGLFGTAYMINYLHDQLTAHESNHNQNIATELIPQFGTTFEKDLKDSSSRLSRSIEDYKAFGFRLFVVDRISQTLVVDSTKMVDLPIALKDSWLATTPGLDKLDKLTSLDNQSVLDIDDYDHPVLIWLQEIDTTQPGRYVLGVAKNQEAVTVFMRNLHLNTNFTMMLIFSLITLLGYFSLRSISRLYERRLENQLTQRTVELEAAYTEIIHKSRLAMIGQTASVLTHEMRNPLASIKLALSSLRGTSQLTERENKRVELVLGEVDRLDNLLSETLGYVRPIKLSRKPVDFDQLLRQVIRQQKPVMKQKGISLNNEGCTECTDIILDEAQTHQVLLNLVKNAVEASPEGGLIHTSLFRLNEQLIFEISNQGKPMDSETLQRAFEPFFTTKHQGTGLGLGLVKRVVEEHDGKVSIESNSEIGTRVTIVFPLKADIHTDIPDVVNNAA